MLASRLEVNSIVISDDKEVVLNEETLDDMIQAEVEWHRRLVWRLSLTQHKRATEEFKNEVASSLKLLSVSKLLIQKTSLVKTK
jgi:hypothetical protein